jgi:hypothetical protein
VKTDCELAKVVQALKSGLEKRIAKEEELL